jgi:hypothetical protein
MAYLPTGADEESSRRDELLVIAQKRLVIDGEQLRIAKRSALIDGLKLAVTVAVPLAVFFGVTKYFQAEKKKETYGGI